MLHLFKQKLAYQLFNLTLAYISLFFQFLIHIHLSQSSIRLLAEELRLCVPCELNSCKFAFAARPKFIGSQDLPGWRRQDNS